MPDSTWDINCQVWLANITYRHYALGAVRVCVDAGDFAGAWAAMEAYWLAEEQLWWAMWWMAHAARAGGLTDAEIFDAVVRETKRRW